MARCREEVPVDPSLSTTPPTVAALLDEFAVWLKARVEDGSQAQRTFDWYADYLNSFLTYLAAQEASKPELPTITVDKLQPVPVYRWVDANPGWKAGGRRGAMVAVQRALNWCARVGMLKPVGGRSPLASLEKPGQGRCEQLSSPEEYTWIIARVKDQDFQDLLETS